MTMKNVLEAVRVGNHSSREIYHHVEYSQGAVYQAIKYLYRTGNLKTSVGENDRNMPHIRYNMTEKGSQLLSALVVVENCLK